MTLLSFRINRHEGEPGLGLVSEERRGKSMDGINFSHGRKIADVVIVDYNGKQVDIHPGTIRTIIMNLLGRRTEVTVTHEPIPEEW